MIADSIELVARGHLFDGARLPRRLRQDQPGRRDGARRLDIPAVIFYRGSIAPGIFRGRDVTIGDVYEAIGALRGRDDRRGRAHELESVACPGAGACGGQFTANTMSTMLEFLGLARPG